jgi:hypothetical protein
LNFVLESAIRRVQANKKGLQFSGRHQILVYADYVNLLDESITNLLTTWSRRLLEKLTVSKLVKKFPAFYGTRRFITAFKRARHLSLS